LWRPCLISDQDKIRKLYKADAPVQKLILLAIQFQRRRVLNVSADQKHESSMATFFLSGPDKMRKLHKAHSIDAPNQIFIHLAVLEKIFKCISQSETRIFHGRHVFCPIGMK